jgi:hypothetical protein
LNILIGLVVVIFIITGAYVGYHASQQSMDEAEGHDVTMEFELFNDNAELMPALQYHEFKKSSL